MKKLFNKLLTKIRFVDYRKVENVLEEFNIGKHQRSEILTKLFGVDPEY